MSSQIARLINEAIQRNAIAPRNATMAMHHRKSISLEKGEDPIKKVSRKKTKAYTHNSDDDGKKSVAKNTLQGVVGKILAKNKKSVSAAASKDSEHGGGASSAARQTEHAKEDGDTTTRGNKAKSKFKGAVAGVLAKSKEEEKRRMSHVGDVQIVQETARLLAELDKSSVLNPENQKKKKGKTQENLEGGDGEGDVPATTTTGKMNMREMRAGALGTQGVGHTGHGGGQVSHKTGGFHAGFQASSSRPTQVQAGAAQRFKKIKNAIKVGAIAKQSAQHTKTAGVLNQLIITIMFHNIFISNFQNYLTF